MQSAILEETTTELEEARHTERVDRLSELFPQLKRHRLMNDTEFREVAFMLAKPGLASDTIWRWLEDVTRYMQRLDRAIVRPSSWTPITRGIALAFRV